MGLFKNKKREVQDDIISSDNGNQNYQATTSGSSKNNNRLNNKQATTWDEYIKLHKEYYKGLELKPPLIMLGKEAYIEDNAANHDGNSFIFDGNLRCADISVILPHILHSKGNKVIVDPFGHYYEKSKDILTRYGYDVEVMDIGGDNITDHGVKFNIFDILRKDALSRLEYDRDSFIGHIDRYLESIVQYDEEDDPYYIKNEVMLLEAIFIYLMETEPDKDWTLYDVYECLEGVKKEGFEEFHKKFEVLEGKKYQSYWYYMESCYKLRNFPDKFDTVISMAIYDIKLVLDTGVIAGAEDCSRLSFDSYNEAGKQKALFIIPAAGRYGIMNERKNVIIGMIINSFCISRYGFHGVSFPAMHIIMDTANAYDVPNLEKLLAVDRPFAINFMICIDDYEYGQYKPDYEHWKPCLFNCYGIVFLQPKECPFLKEIAPALDFDGLGDEEMILLMDGYYIKDYRKR